jgi:hypothetical protein
MVASSSRRSVVKTIVAGTVLTTLGGVAALSARKRTREAPWLLPVWTAARALVRRCFGSGDHALDVLVPSAASPLPQGVRTFAPFSEEVHDPKLKLARFLAWPICSARRVVAPDGWNEDSVWSALRESCQSRPSRFALVIDRATQTVRPRELFAEEQLTRLRALRSRLLELKHPHCNVECSIFSELMGALREGLPTPPALPWLDLGTREALVVPRLSAVSSPDVFASELARVMQHVAKR